MNQNNTSDSFSTVKELDEQKKQWIQENFYACLRKLRKEDVEYAEFEDRYTRKIANLGFPKTGIQVNVHLQCKARDAEEETENFQSLSSFLKRKYSDNPEVQNLLEKTKGTLKEMERFSEKSPQLNFKITKCWGGEMKVFALLKCHSKTVRKINDEEMYKRIEELGRVLPQDDSLDEINLTMIFDKENAKVKISKMERNYLVSKQKELNLLRTFLNDELVRVQREATEEIQKMGLFERIKNIV